MKLKKLSVLLTAAIFTAGVSVAQNDATVDQNNSYNLADVSQSGSNEAMIEQTSTAGDVSNQNEAYVSQVGTDNYLNYSVKGQSNMLEAGQSGLNNIAHIKQGNWFDAGFNDRNHVIVEQTSFGEFEAAGNEAYLELKGDDNEIFVEQTGDGNYIGGTGEMGGDALSTTSSHSSAFFKYEGDASDIDLTQDGAINGIMGEVHNSYGIVDVAQDGSFNYADLRVGVESGLLFNNEIMVDQAGAFNGAMIHQESNANIADVNQVGAWNSTSIVQE